MVTLCFFSACHNSIWEELENLDQRVAKLEELCKEMNTNITSLQTIVSVIQANDYITGIVEIKKNGEVIGYTITFGKHDPITIYHGQDGKDGTDGKDGQDGANGSTPVIGVARDTDGVYYWTLNGEWLLDDNGNKLPVSGKDGANGADGKDGQDGKDGADGQDGVTPLLKIEDGYWYVSYDNGTTWTLMGKATGADGQNGADGKDGVTPLLKIENGYWYISYDNGATWAQLGKATGEDGKDGQNGTNGTDGKDGQDGVNGSNGKDGITPLLKIEDGYWYVSYDNGTTWTQFGKATGADGQNGTNGTDGKDGQDGKDGSDGITPQLKIEDGYWYISYDNGVTWKELGKATGEDGKDGTDGQDGSNGKDGADGKDGKDGDSMFQSVTQDDDYVYFTLADGTVIKIAKRNGTTDQPDSDFIFTITYDPNGGEGVMKKDTFYYGYAGKISACTFWREGYYYTGYWNTNPKGTGASYKSGYQLTIDRNIVLYAQWEEALGTPFEWVDLGLSVKWATCNVGASKPEEYGYYFAWGETQARKTTTYNWSTYKWCNGSDKTITKYCTNSSYGIVDNKTVLDREDDAAAINWGGGWRIPTYAEWTELCNNCSWSWTTTNGVVGRKVTGKTGNSIFLPAAGIGAGGSINFVGRDGYYIVNSYNTTYPNQSIVLEFDKSTVSFGDTQRCYGCSARPVCP